jgi:hypothetical protein
MSEITIHRGITGVLRPFREYLTEMGVKSGDQIVYYGCAGTCTPLVELLAIAVRAQGFNQVFVPLLDESKAKRIHEIPDVGMQVSDVPVEVKPKVLVIMGGLSMPYMPVTKDQVKDLIGKHRDVIVVGVCFMSMFEKAGWLDTIGFDLLIDGTLDPVTVTKR